MTLLAQQGYGKSDKIERGLADKVISGAILSPRDLNPDAMRQYIAKLRKEFSDEVELLFDPQFYASVIPDATERNLAEYGYFKTGLTRSDFLSASAVTKFAESTLKLQSGLELTHLLAPTVGFDSFSEPLSQTALQLGAEAIEVRSKNYDGASLFVSFLIGESALADSDGLDEFLDILSSWEVDGYYIIVEPLSSTYPSEVHPDRLANLMYLAYTLGSLHGYKLCFGYADFYALLLRAVGAGAQATGWYGGLRQFSRTRWMPSTGGSAPRPRYSSGNLINSILQIPSLSSAYQVELLDLCVSHTAYDGDFSTNNPADVEWKMPEQCMHHWAIISELSNHVSGTDVGANLTNLVALVEEARTRYEQLEAAGVQFDHNSGPTHLADWLHAITAFRNKIKS